MIDRIPTPAEVTIWQQRWDVMRAAIDAAIVSLPPGLHRHDDFVCLLRSLSGFAEQQVRYFLGGLTQPDREVGGFTRETALAATLAQVGHDLAAITQAAHQRLLASAGTMQSLKLADRITANMLKTAVDQELLYAEPPFDERPIALTYFQKYPSVRVIPYAPLAFIGVPYTTIDFGAGNPRGIAADYLAIPHEVGHYVYWNGYGRNGEGKRTSFYHLVPKAFSDAGLSDVPLWVRKWGEEVFADVYGCFTAGPMIGIDFQDLELHGTTSAGFVKDDGDHPCPVVRPEVYVMALTEQGAGGWPEALRIRWDYKLSGRAIPRRDEDDVTHSLSGTRTIQLGTMRSKLERVVTIAHELLSGAGMPAFNLGRLDDEFRGGAPVVPENPTPDQIESIAGQLDGLYQSWASEVATEAQALIAGGDGLASGKLRGCNPDFWTAQTWEAWRDDLINESIRVWGFEDTDDNRWQIILRAGGWTIEGPDSNPPQ